MSYREQLKQFFAKTFRGWYITVTTPKKFLLDCGFPDLPIVIRPSTLNAKIEKHNLSKDDLEQLNTQLNSPLMVFKGKQIGNAFNVVIEKRNEEGFLCCSIHPEYKINKLLVNDIASIHGRRISQLTDWCENKLLIKSNVNKTKKILSDSCLNDSKCEYLISLLDDANVRKGYEINNENTKKLNGGYTMKLTKDNVLEKWGDAKLILQDKKEFIDLAEDSFIPFANLYDEFDEDMKKDFDSFLDTANKLLEEKENKKEEAKPKFKVGDWVISKIHTPEGVKESFPILITEVMVMPNGKVAYTFDGGEIDVFEDEIIRKTTDPNKKKKVDAKDAKDYTTITENLQESKESLTKTAERKAESNGFGVDLEKEIEAYKKSVKHNDFDDMFIILELLEACNFHKEREFFIKQDWKGLKKFIKSEEEKEKPKKEPKTKAEKPTFNTKSVDILTEAVGMDKKKLIKIIEDTPKNLKTSNEFKDLIGGLGISKVIHFVNKVTNESYYDGMKAGLRFEDLMVDFITDATRRDEIVKDYLKKETTKPKSEKPTSTATPVEALSPEVKLIKRVITLQGKTIKKANSEKTNNPRAILNAIQRAIRTKQIRKTSKYADEIMYAQDALIRMVNGSLNGTLSGADVINFTRYDDLEKVAHSEVVSEAAKIAAQFIKIQEQAGKEKEAGTLLKRIEKSNEKGEEIDGMKKALKNYVDGKTTKLKASEQVLRGLHGIVDVNFESGDVVNSTTIEGKNFDTLDFHGRWEGFFGKPSPDFKFMFYGKPGNGKSTFALQFAGYLSKELGKSVLYVANEEGFGYTLQEKVKRLNVANSNLYLCDSVPEDLTQFDVVFLDSVNNLGLEPEDLKSMPSGKAYVYIFQTTKDGNYMGKQEFAHDVDTVVRVENMNAYKDKNRYGGEIQEFKVG